jgi:hypothetical protein
MTSLHGLIALLATVLPLAAAPPDLLRLADGTLEGTFESYTAEGTVRWQRPDAVQPLEFRTDRIRHIALRGGNAVHTGPDTSHVRLINDDRIPGRIVSLADGVLTIDSPVAGTVSIPMAKVKSVEPNPFGGRLVYAGPFSEEGWETVEPDTDDPEKLEKDEEKKNPTWVHHGASWYYTGGPEAIRLDAGMPRKSVVRFRMDWRNRPPITIALYGDLARQPEPPAPAEGEEAPRLSRPNIVTAAFGNCLSLTVRSNYASLQECGYGENGQPFARVLRSSSSSVNFENTGSAEFEIRTNLDAGTVSLYANGSFCIQWDLARAADEPVEMGGAMGFAVPGSHDPVRISDIIVAEWNGLPDAARSLESEHQDIVLLTNGTDRFSGKVATIADGRMHLVGNYAEFDVPLDEIAAIHLAHDGREKAGDPDADAVTLRFQPVGRLSGRPLSADRGHMKLDSPILGEVNADLSAAALIIFEPGGQFLKDWEDDL